MLTNDCFLLNPKLNHIYLKHIQAPNRKYILDLKYIFKEFVQNSKVPINPENLISYSSFLGA
jgi:hypothetical protein